MFFVAIVLLFLSSSLRFVSIAFKLNLIITFADELTEYKVENKHLQEKLNDLKRSEVGNSRSKINNVLLVKIYFPN